MPLERRTAVRLRDIRRSCLEAQRFLAGLEAEAFAEDVLRIRAIERCLEILGEAVRALPPEFKAQQTHIAWHLMVGLRNVLAHEYSRVNLPKIHEIVVVNVPELLVQVTRSGFKTTTEHRGEIGERMPGRRSGGILQAFRAEPDAADAAEIARGRPSGFETASSILLAQGMLGESDPL